MPIGEDPAGKAYNRFDVEFQGIPHFNDLYGYFLSTTMPAGTWTECSTPYNCVPNHGIWTINAARPDLNVFYHGKAWPNTLTFPASSCPSAILWTLLKRPSGSSWGLSPAPTYGDPCSGVTSLSAGWVNRTNYKDFSDFVVISTDQTPMPVEFFEFNAIPKNDHIALDWTTHVEKENAGFFIERSTDASNFQSLGWLDGAGFSNTAKQYQFPDTKVQKNVLYYYRLKQVDFNGVHQYSEVKSAMLTDVNGIQLSVYPNPARESIFIKVIHPQSENYSVELFNALGQSVLKYSWNTKDNTTLSLPIKELTPGIYNLVVQSGLDKVEEKIVIMK